ncbi:MAG: DUF5714 domain-containing protein [Lactimicrobium sp.]|jgi:hypothetical protein|uniref:DUF5714 domain-containing protein n=1 Tax=Lactimicrobium sp. TaxID=2563780 RepID=UPI002F35C041
MNDMEIRGNQIIDACLIEKSTSPYEIFVDIAEHDFVRMHGPEHHILDGACILTACHNAGLDFDLMAALAELMQRGLQMPGAMCGMWGVCGAVASIGAALSILESTGPLTTNDSWGSHMAYTSKALEKLSVMGGPRCCKRDAYTAMETAVDYINQRYGIHLQKDDITCGFYPQNAQCKKEGCPYYPLAKTNHLN